MKFFRVTKRHPCRICGKPDYCGIAEGGEFAICMRESSDRQAKNGGWIHSLTDDPAPIRKKPVPLLDLNCRKLPVVTRSDDDLDLIYSTFLRQLVLSQKHEADLIGRGLGQTDIDLHGYKSMPTKRYGDRICRMFDLSARLDLAGVPGFYRTGSDWHFIDYRNATGWLVPIRNGRHRIVGLQLRRDDDKKPKYLMMSSGWHKDGANSGTPPHFAYLGIVGAPSSFKEIIITEGALKANIIAKYTGIPTVGLVGVGCFDDTLPGRLLEAFPWLERVRIAFDMDAATNKQVRAQRDRLHLTIEKNKLKTSILSWDGRFKGFDDFLVSTKSKLKLAA